MFLAVSLLGLASFCVCDRPSDSLQGHGEPGLQGAETRQVGR
jgi:hypothetical protein